MRSRDILQIRANREEEVLLDEGMLASRHNLALPLRNLGHHSLCLTYCLAAWNTVCCRIKKQVRLLLSCLCSLEEALVLCLPLSVSLSFLPFTLFLVNTTLKLTAWHICLSPATGPTKGATSCFSHNIWHLTQSSSPCVPEICRDPGHELTA